MRDLRILCLHGYHGTASVLRQQMSPMTAGLDRSIEFVYEDAPSLAENDFGWWHSPARGWDRTRAWAVDLFASQRFDGVFGFSQGAALTGLLAGMRERAMDGITFDFAVVVSGFMNDSPDLAELYRPQFTVPSVHVISRVDAVIPPRMSHDLAARFTEPTVLEHSGGHIVPGDSHVVVGVEEFLDRMARVPEAAPADCA
jgi:dienelactone hydrolase